MEMEHEGTRDDERRIIVDEDWKEQAQAEKEALQRQLEEQRRGESEAGAEEKTAAQRDAGRQSLPPASMATLISSLATQAALALQGIQVEGQPPVPPDLPVARHLIDTLEVLEKKTAGNLTDEEATMLTGVLRELQLLYVELVSQVSKVAKSSESS